MHSLTEFLFPEPARRTAPAIVRWWEKRRLFYNVAVGTAGLFSMVVVSTLVSLLEGEFVLVPWQGTVAFGVMANVCYFSVGLALLPTLVAVFVTVIRLFLDSNFP